MPVSFDSLSLPDRPFSFHNASMEVDLVQDLGSDHLKITQHRIHTGAGRSGHPKRCLRRPYFANALLPFLDILQPSASSKGWLVALHI